MRSQSSNDRSDVLVTHLRDHALLSLDMLDEVARLCPDHIWTRKVSGYVYWQQILHTLTGALYWTRSAPGPFVEPFHDLVVYPELDGEPETDLTKGELSELSAVVRRQMTALFEQKTDQWLYAPSAVTDKLLNLDVIEMQIRHLQYHVGHCNSILRHHNETPAGWLEYTGEDPALGN
jgi:hypothetical protein